MSAYLATAPASGRISGSGKNTAEDSFIRQIRKKISRVHPDENKLWQLMEMTGGAAEAIRANTFEWYAKGMNRIEYTLTNAPGASGTTLSFDTTNGLVPDQILTVAKAGVNSENLVIASITNTTDVVVYTRGSQGGGAAAVLAAGDVIVKGSVGRPEGASANVSTSDRKVKRWNYWQEFEEVAGWTTRQVINLRHGERIEDEEVRDAISRYKTQVEHAAIFGKKVAIAAGETGGGTHGKWLTGGVLEAMPGDHNFSANGAWTRSKLNRWLPIASRYSPTKVYVGLCGTEVASIMDDWASGEQHADYSQHPEYGWSFKSFKGNNFRLNLIQHPLFDIAPYNEWLLCLCMKGLAMRDALKMTVNGEITGPKKDGNRTITTQIVAGHGFEHDHEYADALFTEITN